MAYRIAPSSPPAKPTTCGDYSPQERGLRPEMRVTTQHRYEELLRRERLLLDIAASGDILSVELYARLKAL